jgi:hypothetical protein
MSSFVDSLNLRPQEKRLIVGIGVIAFLVLNYLFVIPHFKDYGRMQRERAGILQTNQNFSKEIAADNPTTGYKKKLDDLAKSGADASALQYSTAIQLQTTISRKAAEAGITVQSYDPVNLVRLSTNAATQFFESESIRISVEATESNLVNFLYNIGNDPAMIRVREFDLHPVDANRYSLKGQITLTADYRKSDKDAKLVAVKTSVPAPAPAKTIAPAPPATPPKTMAPPALPPPPNRGPVGVPATNGHPNLPTPPRGERRQNAGGRESRAVTPPAFPTLPTRTPPVQPLPPQGNNQ